MTQPKVHYESKMADFKRRLDAAENKLLHAIGHGVGGQATLMAPVDTGNLANSIDYRTQDTAKEVSVSIGTPVEYGIYQELGTSKMGAQPYLTPAFEAQMPAIKDMARKEYGEIEGPANVSVRQPE